MECTFRLAESLYVVKKLLPLSLPVTKVFSIAGNGQLATRALPYLVQHEPANAKFPFVGLA
jgi:hypothetical protein